VGCAPGRKARSRATVPWPAEDVRAEWRPGAGEQLLELACPSDQVACLWRFSMPSVGLRSLMAFYAQHFAVGQDIAAAHRLGRDVMEMGGVPRQRDIASPPIVAVTLPHALTTGTGSAERRSLGVLRKISHLVAPICSRASCGHRTKKPECSCGWSQAPRTCPQWVERCPRAMGALQSMAAARAVTRAANESRTRLGSVAPESRYVRCEQRQNPATTIRLASFAKTPLSRPLDR